MKIGILGAGTWGVALAKTLCQCHHAVTVWSALGHEIDALRERNGHPNLAGVALPREICYTKEIAQACLGAEAVIFAVPSSYMRQTAREASPYLEAECMAVSVAKGFEKESLCTMTDIIAQERRAAGTEGAVLALSGPTHAEEVARDVPTSIVAACEREGDSLRLAEAFQGSCLRVYTNTDVLGVEICGAMKNIIALGAGICGGMGFGDNTKAMLITRGAREICRLGVAMGSSMHTFMGLAGIGDLIVTCISRHSRNNRCGELIGRGYSYEEAQKEIGMVVEGYHALAGAMRLSAKYGVELPITEAVNAIVHGGVSPKDVMAALMHREIKSEAFPL